jgi:uncharacterized protein YjbI with pentapeptide repeats
MNSPREMIERVIRSGGSLRGQCFARADLTGLVVPPCTDLRFVNLNGAILNGAVLDGCLLDNAKLAGAEVWNLKARGVSAVGADFSRTNAQEADFRGSNLSQARFDGAELPHADFRSDAGYGTTRLAGASFARAWLLDAQFDDGEPSDDEGAEYTCIVATTSAFLPVLALLCI